MDELDLEITIDGHREAIIRYSNTDGTMEVKLFDLVTAANDWLTREQMNVLYEELDRATCHARRLSRNQ